MNPAPACNLELKIRCRDLDAARQAVYRLCGDTATRESQTDTYFNVPNGRLKLREIAGQPALLIWYERPDRAEARASSYHLVPVTDSNRLKAALTEALGLRGVVAKTREIYWWHNVRIHLDTVAGLGTFVEFEAVLSPEADEETSRARLCRLTQELGLSADEHLAPSYLDLLGIGLSDCQAFPLLDDAQ